MRSASRSDGRDTPKRSTRSDSRPSDAPSASEPLTISARSSSAMSSGFSRPRDRDAAFFGAVVGAFSALSTGTVVTSFLGKPQR